MAMLQNPLISKVSRCLSPLIVRHIHSRHFPNDVINVAHPKPEDFDKIKNADGQDWPFYGGRISVSKKKRQRFPQSLPKIDSSPYDIRDRQLNKTLRFGSNPRTYPTLLVYPDGSTLTIPYHKPVGTLFLPGEDKQISLGVKTKTRNMRRVKIGVR